MIAIPPPPSAWAAGELLRPPLGGGLPGATPVATAVSGGGGSGGVVTPGPVPGGTDITLIVLLVAGIFAFFGFIDSFYNLRRKAIILGIVGLTYILLDYMWGTVAQWINHFWKLFYFAIIKGGIFVDDPGPILKEVKDMEGLVPTGDDAVYWQIALYLLAVGFAFLITAPVWWPKPGIKYELKTHNLAERMISAIMMGAVGGLSALFIFDRLIPNASFSLFMPGTAYNDWIRYVVPITMGILVAAIIFYGYRNLGNRKIKKTYS